MADLQRPRPTFSRRTLRENLEGVKSPEEVKMTFEVPPASEATNVAVAELAKAESKFIPPPAEPETEDITGLSQQTLDELAAGRRSVEHEKTRHSTELEAGRRAVLEAEAREAARRTKKV